MYSENQWIIKMTADKRYTTRTNILFVSFSIASYNNQNNNNPAAIIIIVATNDAIIVFTSFLCVLPTQCWRKRGQGSARVLADLQGKDRTRLLSRSSCSYKRVSVGKRAKPNELAGFTKRILLC